MINIDSKKDKKKHSSHSSDLLFPHSILYRIRKNPEDTTDAATSPQATN
jgi:hypothetical protein